MSTAGRCPHLDPSEPPERAPVSLSGGGFPAPEALDPLRAVQSLEVAELLASIDRCTADLAALVLDADRYTAELAELLEGHGL